MATKSDFTEEEWQVLRWAVADVVAYLSLADRGFWDTFKEASGAAKYMAAARGESSSLLVRDLAADVKASRDKELTQNPTNMAGEVSERVSEAAALVARVAPDESDAFRSFVIGLAEATAGAADGIAAQEGEGIEIVRGALG